MLLALPVSADVGTFTLTDRAEVRARDPDPVLNSTALDLDTLFDARAIFKAHKAEYTLAYLPRLSLLDANGGAAAQGIVMNGFLGTAAWHPTARVEIGVRELGSYGLLTFASLSTVQAPGSPAPTGVGGQPPPVPTAQLVPTAQTVLFFSSSTSVYSTLQLRPWMLTGVIGYQLSGGADAHSQQSLPFQDGPFAQGIGDYRAGPRDHLVTLLTGTEVAFSPIGTDALVVTAEEQWRHHLAQRTDTMLGAGASEQRVRTGPSQPDQYSTGAVADASIRQGFKRGVSEGALEFRLRMLPIVNQLTGLVDEQAQAVATAGWTRKRLGARAAFTAAGSVDQGEAQAAKYASGEVDLSYKLSDPVTLDTGGRMLWQEQNGAAVVSPTGQSTQAGAVTFTQAVVFFAVTVRFVQARF